MNSEAMSLYGKALLDYYNGDNTAEIIVRRDDGFETKMSVSLFFRSLNELLPGEAEALDQCRGHVLDIGAGSGIHTLILQSRGLAVTSIDIDPNACKIMSQRGIKDVHCVDVMNFQGGPYDTLLLLGHGIGMVENIEGLILFLKHSTNLICPNGQVIISSVDVSKTDDPVHLKYHQINYQLGRYIGETRVQFEYKKERGPFCGWLHIDPQTLQEQSEPKKWIYNALYEDKSGEYSASMFYKGSV